MASIRYGAELCLNNKALALVTGPINKDQLNQQGFGFTGHTDFLEELCNAKAVMGFVGGDIRVALATVHIPPYASRATIINIQSVFNSPNYSSFPATGFVHISPKIIVCGLNPHLEKMDVWDLRN